MSKEVLKYGLYRHFKGGYYYVTNLVIDTTDEVGNLVIYHELNHPNKSFSRKVEEWSSDVTDRPDNVTGQIHRFERVESIDFQLRSVTTEQLIKELNTRPDNPYASLDIEGLNNKVVSVDYIVGNKDIFNEEYPFITPIAVFDDKESAHKYLKGHKLRRGTTVFKRTYINEE